jgi:hypothetical protein
MSGGFVAYNIRQNKAIDRSLFVDMLVRLGAKIPIHEYEYISMGGAFMEDFKLMHSQFGMERMISIESDERVLRRQKFNRPLSCVRLVKDTAGQFIDRYSFNRPTIMWLDYASPKNIGTQLSEVEGLVGKLDKYDLIKVTLNASLDSLRAKAKSAMPSDLEPMLRARVGNSFLPEMIDPSLLEDEYEYPKLMLKGFERAVKRACEGKNDTLFQPLSAYVYADGAHRMLTASGILLPGNEIENFLLKTAVAEWPLAMLKWGDPYSEPKEIAIPDLSIRERLYFDAKLPRMGVNSKAKAQIVKTMGHLFPKNYEDRGVQQYAEYYRYLPYLTKSAL